MKRYVGESIFKEVLYPLQNKLEHPFWLHVAEIIMFVEVPHSHVHKGWIVRLIAIRGI